MTPTGVEEGNLITVSRALVEAATMREESRGTHTRADHPAMSEAFSGRLVFTGTGAPTFVPLAAEAPEPTR
jgi:L-aspartate oxidase